MKNEEEKIGKMGGKNNRITLKNVWTWINAGCNAEEIAAYGEFSIDVAKAWMEAARREFIKSHA